MASLARIFYAKSDGGTMDNKVSGALSLGAVVDFLNETAHVRTTTISSVQFSPDGYIYYDRNAGFVRKSVRWNVAPTEQTNGFVAPSPSPGYCCTTLALCHFEDRERAVSRNGYRTITIPGPIETIEEHESDIQLAVRNLFLCHTLVLAKIAFLSTRNNFFG